MIRVELTIDDAIIEAYRDLFKKLPVVTRKAFKGEITRLSSPMLDALTATPGAPHYPIRWKSERQRRAFFATDGFGRGIPTQRSGALQAGWQVAFEGDQFGSTIEVFNTQPHARFVQGDDAQPFHLDTGWPQAAPIIVDFQEDVTDALVNTWFSITEFTETL